MKNFRPDPNIDRIRLKIFGFSMKARELFFFDKIRIESILEKRNGNNQRNEKDQSNWWYRFERLIEMGIQMIEYLDSRDSFLILLIKNTHFFEGSNRWIINLIETTISNARTNAQKIFCKIKMGIKGYSYTYIYIYIVHRKWSHDMKYVAVSSNNAQYCPYSTACQSENSWVRWSSIQRIVRLSLSSSSSPFLVIDYYHDSRGSLSSW